MLSGGKLLNILFVKFKLFCENTLLLGGKMLGLTRISNNESINNITN